MKPEKVYRIGNVSASIFVNEVQTDGGNMFIAGMTSVQEPPVNDIWSVPGEEGLLDGWIAEDTARFESVDPATHYHELQIKDFLRAIMEDRPPMIDGAEGRKSVEIIEAIYRSQREGKAIKFPLAAEE